MAWASRAPWQVHAPWRTPAQQDCRPSACELPGHIPAFRMRHQDASHPRRLCLQVVKQCRALAPAAFDRGGPVGSVGFYCIVQARNSSSPPLPIRARRARVSGHVSRRAQVEGMRRSTAVEHSAAAGTAPPEPAWNVPMQFDVTDLHADVAVQARAPAAPPSLLPPAATRHVALGKDMDCASGPERHVSPCASGLYRSWGRCVRFVPGGGGDAFGLYRGMERGGALGEDSCPPACPARHFIPTRAAAAALPRLPLRQALCETRSKVDASGSGCKRKKLNPRAAVRRCGRSTPWAATTSSPSCSGRLRASPLRAAGRALPAR